jgi:hypothetical protein
MAKLYKINPDGIVVVREQAELDWDKMKLLINSHDDITIEHVTVIWKGLVAHMFVDEEGRMHHLLPNPKATRIYYNFVYKREGRLDLLYDDLSQPAKLTGLESPGFDIVGTAVLLEGPFT